MQLQFLGTGGYHPNERRHTACLMVPELGLVFDAGSSAFRIQSRVITDEVDLFLTHAHLDHVQGLTYLLVPLARGLIKRCRVHALPQTIAAVREHLFSQPIFPVMPDIDFCPLSTETKIASGRGSITHRSLQHPGGSLGYKLNVEGKQLAYITDTTVDDSYTDFIRGVDVLIHECYFPDDLSDWAAKTGHSHTSQVAALAKKADVGRLYLTHIDPQRSDDDPIGIAIARKIFPATEIAEDLMEIEF